MRASTCGSFPICTSLAPRGARTRDRRPDVFTRTRRRTHGATPPTSEDCPCKAEFKHDRGRLDGRPRRGVLRRLTDAWIDVARGRFGAHVGRARERRPGHDRPRCKCHEDRDSRPTAAILIGTFPQVRRNGRAAPIFCEKELNAGPREGTTTPARGRGVGRSRGCRTSRCSPSSSPGPSASRCSSTIPTGSTTRSASRSPTSSRDYLEHYSLDVSSPGLERPLRTPEHFAASWAGGRRSGRRATSRAEALPRRGRRRRTSA